MISKRKLLKYINKNPDVSYKDIAEKFFNNDIEVTSKELIRNKDFINGNWIYDCESKNYAIETVENITINSIGKEYLEELFNEKWRFRIPIIISIVSLIISFSTLFLN